MQHSHQRPTKPHVANVPRGSRTFTLRTFKGLPKKLFRQKKLFVALSTSTRGRSPSLTEQKLHK